MVSCSVFVTNVKASRFTCQLKILNTIMPITPGLPVMFYSRGNAIDATIKKLNATLDKNGANLKSRPKVCRVTSDWSANKKRLLGIEIW